MQRPCQPLVYTCLGQSAIVILNGALLMVHMCLDSSCRHLGTCEWLTFARLREAAQRTGQGRVRKACCRHATTVAISALRPTCRICNRLKPAQAAGIAQNVQNASMGAGNR